MTCSGEEKECTAHTYLVMSHDNTKPSKPLTRHYGYGFLAGLNMATCTRTRDYNPHKTRGFTLTRADHYT